MSFLRTVTGIAAFMLLVFLLTGPAVDQEQASGAGITVATQRHNSVPFRTATPERIQGRTILWWHRRTIQARRDANKRQLTIFRLRRENVILRKKIEWQLERRVGNRSHWLCIHRGERGAAGWATNTGNGYYGGLQMNYGFMRTYGPELLRSKGTADQWTMEEQMMVAERARASGRGYYPWPTTARACGLIR